MEEKRNSQTNNNKIKQKTEQVPRKSEQEAKKQLNQLIEKHNGDMLKLLENEQEAENERQKKFSEASNDEKRKLQREFGYERAKAQARIQKLSEYFILLTQFSSCRSQKVQNPSPNPSLSLNFVHRFVPILYF